MPLACACAWGFRRYSHFAVISTVNADSKKAYSESPNVAIVFLASRGRLFRVFSRVRLIIEPAWHASVHGFPSRSRAAVVLARFGSECRILFVLFVLFAPIYCSCFSANSPRRGAGDGLRGFCVGRAFAYAALRLVGDVLCCIPLRASLRPRGRFPIFPSAHRASEYSRCRLVALFSPSKSATSQGQGRGPLASSSS